MRTVIIVGLNHRWNRLQNCFFRHKTIAQIEIFFYEFEIPFLTHLRDCLIPALVVKPSPEFFEKKHGLFGKVLGSLAIPCQFLVNNGYNVLLFDYREIGESTPIDLKLSEAFMHDWGILDMSAAFNYTVEVQNLTNIVWIGLSVGGQLVGVLEKREHIKHLIFISGALGYWGIFSISNEGGCVDSVVCD